MNLGAIKASIYVMCFADGDEEGPAKSQQAENPINKGATGEIGVTFTKGAMLAVRHNKHWVSVYPCGKYVV